ncbi:acyltransferase family protein [Segetibacter aerophilus]|uniref:Acyltransferase n=1 Tax=Segetibacter aerophilus TaxID=670293 RepID=A0A512BB84_9BACT|nr:acyltransferase [Segetibacter aerophilus]GEO09239.1 acyltransferase [Segetibacter aerophilus]
MKKENLKQDVLQTRQHFEILDGLRGVAALAVVIFHFMEWVFTDPNKNFIGHGFLAVDFFFCLSGFVMGYAYDSRITEMGVGKFFRLRLIRLHPLVVLGSVLGLVGFFLDPFASPVAYNASRIALLFVCSVFLIPFPVMQDRAFNLFGLNAPSWSLFWEYVANIFYAFVLYKVGRRMLAVLTMIAAAGIFMVTNRAGNLLGGWSKDNFLDGGARVAYSFLAGLLIYRSNWIIKNSLGFMALGILLFLAFLMPGSKWNWLTEPMIVLLYFPLLVSLGAGSSLSTGWKKVCTFSGNISYPLYMSHYAVIWVFGNYFTNKKPPAAQLPYIIIPGIILLVFIAYLVMVFYDIPLRRYLSQKWQQERKHQTNDRRVANKNGFKH